MQSVEELEDVTFETKAWREVWLFLSLGVFFVWGHGWMLETGYLVVLAFMAAISRFRFRREMREVTGFAR